MRSSLLDRLLGAALVLLLSAWAISKAVHLIVAVAPVLFGIGVTALAGCVGYRIYRSRSSGW